MEYSETPDAVYEALAQAAKGLAHPKRLEVLDLLAQGERPVDSISESVRLGVTTTSAHLQILFRAGLVDRRREGTRVLYRLPGDDVARLLMSLRSVAERRSAALELARRVLLDDDLPVTDLPPAELAAGARAGRLIVLDVRGNDEYAAGHLAGARSLPLGELEARLSELPPGTPVVAYCRGSYCVMSHAAVALLRERGFDAAVTAEGVLEWRAAGHEMIA